MNYFGRSEPAAYNYWTGRGAHNPYDDVLGIPPISGVPQAPAITPEVSTGFFGNPNAKDEVPGGGGEGGGGSGGGFDAGSAALAFGPTILGGLDKGLDIFTGKGLVGHGKELLGFDGASSADPSSLPTPPTPDGYTLSGAGEVFGANPYAPPTPTPYGAPVADLGSIAALPTSAIPVGLLNSFPAMGTIGTEASLAPYLLGGAPEAGAALSSASLTGGSSAATLAGGEAAAGATQGLMTTAGPAAAAALAAYILHKGVTLGDDPTPFDYQAGARQMQQFKDDLLNPDSDLGKYGSSSIADALSLTEGGGLSDGYTGGNGVPEQVLVKALNRGTPAHDRAQQWLKDIGASDPAGARPYGLDTGPSYINDQGVAVSGYEVPWLDPNYIDPGVFV
jgi:hypothetical protein